MSAATKSTAAGLENLADETKSAGAISEIGDFASAAIKGRVLCIALYRGRRRLVDRRLLTIIPTEPSDPLEINQYGSPAPVSNNPAKLLGSTY
jgi:hypothetical protein